MFKSILLPLKSRRKFLKISSILLFFTFYMCAYNPPETGFVDGWVRGSRYLFRMNILSIIRKTILAPPHWNNCFYIIQVTCGGLSVDSICLLVYSYIIPQSLKYCRFIISDDIQYLLIPLGFFFFFKSILDCF